MLGGEQTDSPIRQPHVSPLKKISGIPGRCNAIISLGTLREIDPAILRTVKTLRGQAVDPANKRARIVHDAWYLQEPSGKAGAFRAMPNDDRRFGVHDFYKTGFDRALTAIDALQTTAVAINQRVSAALSTLPKKQN